MKKQLRKALSIILTVCMVAGVGLIPASANQSPFFVFNFNPNATDTSWANIGPQSTQSMREGNQVEIIFPSFLPTLTRPGFVFDGWWTAPTGGQRVNVPGFYNLVSNPPADANNNITLYARWVLPGQQGQQPGQPGQRTITFNVDNAIHATLPTGNDGRLPNLPAEPVKPGFTFVGWFMTTTGGTRITPGASGTQFTQNTTVYAGWAGSYTITFSVDNNPNYATLPTGADGRLAFPAEPVKPGFTFAGWFTAPTGGTRVTPDTQFINHSTVHARWAGSYTITFNTNFNANNPIYATLPTGMDGRLTSFPTNPTRAGFSFVGWFDTAAATGGTQITTGANGYLFTENTTVYARWAQGFTITFSQNDGSVAVAPVTAVTGAGNRLVSLPAAPTRTGFTFVGWFDVPAATGGNQITAGAAGTVFNQNATVYARWAGVFTVTFNANGAGATVTPASAQTAVTGRLASLPTPTRAGHVFAGWFDTAAATGGNEIKAGEQGTVFTQATTVYARWTAQQNDATASVNAREADITAAATANNGGVVTVTMAANSTSVSKEILAVMTGKDMKLVLDFGANGRITIDGKAINYTNNTADLNISLQYLASLNTTIPGFGIPQAAVNSVGGHQVKIGAAPVDIIGSSLNVNRGATFAGMNAILCSYNAAANRFDFVSAATIDVYGNINVDFNRTGDYVMIVRPTGDVTGDGQVMANDALELLRAVTGRITLDAIQFYVASSRHDNTVSANDALNILKFVTGAANRI